ncbi:MAG: Collagen triple helix repeat (20 copies) [candidate division WS2 bacterium ADurb.Bin280]|uniref:Collagen triple helix repeat (20 copies) n=1 Tax=candidate division WS2 bacterium ADurb.Bin280 TaxID=1852829 RepID=A0A1V5SDH8_9BACT|nr:MAG: Collagen triple helix repeat (20 copies) [candidate division WS2 bacterium ADurb.Bin280]
MPGVLLDLDDGTFLHFQKGVTVADDCSVTTNSIVYRGRVVRDGKDGENGKDGNDGAPGTPGKRGPQGPAGPPGVAGPAGPAGPVGPAGAASTVPGPRGPRGSQGPAGPPGVAGPAGPAGPAGNDGNDGEDGEDGADAEPAMKCSAPVTQEAPAQAIAGQEVGAQAAARIIFNGNVTLGAKARMIINPAPGAWAVGGPQWPEASPSQTADPLVECGGERQDNALCPPAVCAPNPFCGRPRRSVASLGLPVPLSPRMTYNDSPQAPPFIVTRGATPGVFDLGFGLLTATAGRSKSYIKLEANATGGAGGSVCNELTQAQDLRNDIRIRNQQDQAQSSANTNAN